MMLLCRLIIIPFEIGEDPAEVIPQFVPEAGVGGLLSNEESQMRLKIIGRAPGSILAISKVVEHLEMDLQLDLIDWEFVPSQYCKENQLSAILYLE